MRHAGERANRVAVRRAICLGPPAADFGPLSTSRFSLLFLLLAYLLLQFLRFLRLDLRFILFFAFCGTRLLLLGGTAFLSLSVSSACVLFPQPARYGKKVASLKIIDKCFLALRVSLSPLKSDEVATLRDFAGYHEKG